MDEVEVENICQALDTLHDPNVDNATRVEALKLCESYKFNPGCAMVGLQLAYASTLPVNARFFGLQLVKHRIRMEWVKLTSEEQLAMKSVMLQMMFTCSKDEPNYFKSLIAIIINEMVKHVWPQCWPTMLEEILDQPLESTNYASHEIIMLFLLALAEDVALYSNVATKSRAKDLRQALALASEQIFSFMLRILKQNAEMLVEKETAYCNRMIEVTLSAVQGYVEWINCDIIFKENGALLLTLFILFQFKNVQVAAADCLHTIVSRKGVLEEKKTLISLTEEAYVIKYAAGIKESSKLEGFTQSRFQFLYIIGKVVCNLANLLVNVWECEERTQDEFSSDLVLRKTFLETLFFVSSHESNVVASTVMHSWSNFLKYPRISKEPVMENVATALIDLLINVLCQKLYAKNNYFSFEEACLNDAEEHKATMDSYKSQVVQVLRTCSLAFPLLATQKCLDCIELHLDWNNFDNEEEYQFRLRAGVRITDTVYRAALLTAEANDQIQLLPIFRTQSVFQRLLAVKTDDVNIMKMTFSIASKMCKLICFGENPVFYFQMLVDIALKMLNELPRCYSRRLACTVLIRLAAEHANVLIHLADHFKSVVFEWIRAEPCKLIAFEKVSLFEVLTIISMEWHDRERQCALLRDIISSTAPFVQSQEFHYAMSGPAEFASAIGLQNSITSPNEVFANPSAVIRTNLYYYCLLTNAILSRTQSKSKDTDPIEFVPNPCVPYLTAAFDHILALSYLISSTWTPAIRQLIYPDNAKALDLRECERKHLICQKAEIAKTGDDYEEKPHWERIQVFLSLTLDNCYAVLGFMGKSLGPEFYNLPSLQQIILQKVLVNIEYLPGLRIKALLRHFLGSFCKYCPIDRVSDVVCPILQSYCCFVLGKLTSAWNAFSKKEFERLQGSEDTDDVEEKEEDEILEEQLLRQVSREHIDFLVTIIVGKSGPKKHTENLERDDLAEDVMRLYEYLHTSTPLGAAVVANPVCEVILQTALRAVSWHDSTTCQKTLPLLGTLLRQLIETNIGIFTENVTRLVLQAILHGIARHGEHDGCISPLSGFILLILQSLKHTHGDIILEVLLSTQTDESCDSMRSFFEKIEIIGEKKRKGIFRKLISNIVIHHEGQRYKEIPEMNNFVPLPRRKKIVDDEVKKVESFGLSELFNPNSKELS